MITDLAQIIEKSTPVITAIVGGIGVKFFEKILSKRSEEFSDLAKIREELRQQITALRTELEKWKLEADQWRQKYWSQVEINIKQKSTYEDDMRSLLQDTDALRLHIDMTADRTNKS